MKSFESYSLDAADVLGIELRERSLRLLQATGNPGYSKVTEAAEWEIPGDAIRDGIVVRPRQLAEAIQERLMNEAFGAKRCVFSVPSRCAVLRDLVLPPMEQAELNEAARFRMKKSIPFALEDAYVEAGPVTNIGDDGNGVTMAVAVPKAIIDSRADMLAYAGLEPIFAETDAQSILRVIHRRAARLDSLARDSSLTVIDIGGGFTSMYVVQQKRLQFLRSVKFGTSDMNNKIAEAAQDNDLRPSAILADPNTCLSAEGQLEFTINGVGHSISMRDDIGRLIREVSRLLRYFQSLHPERSFQGLLSCLLVCGEMASMPGFLEYIESELRFRAELLKPLFEANLGLHARVRDFAERNESKFVTATGCLLRALEDSDSMGGLNHGRFERKYAA